MAGFADKLATAETKHSEPQERRATELSETESTAKEAESAIVGADAFLKEQGDAEAKAEIDALKAEAGETLKRFDALKAELAKINAKIATLERAEESPEKPAAIEAPAEQPTEAEKTGAEVKEQPPYNEKELGMLSSALEKIRSKGEPGSPDRVIAISRLMKKIKDGVPLEKDGPQAIARLGSKGAEMLNKLMDEDAEAIYKSEVARGAARYDVAYDPKITSVDMAMVNIKHTTLGVEALGTMQTIEGVRNEATRKSALARIKENLKGSQRSQRDKGKNELGSLLEALEHDPNLKKTFVEELGPEAMEMYKTRE